MQKTSPKIAREEKAVVLTKALINMACLYDLSGKELSLILGISTAGSTRLHQGKQKIYPDTKEGELALLLLRLYRSLNALLGNHHDKAKLWLTSEHQYFGKTPLEQIKTVTGLVEVVNYLDAMRGKV